MTRERNRPMITNVTSTPSKQFQYLQVRNWDKWQSYRRDRGQPPWIKVHRILMRDANWVALTDAQKGQLVAIWMLAADQNGRVPSSPRLIKKLCCLEHEPDLTMLMSLGFLDAKMTPSRRKHVSRDRDRDRDRDRERSKKDISIIFSLPLGCPKKKKERGLPMEEWMDEFLGFFTHERLARRIRSRSWSVSSRLGCFHVKH